MKHRFAAIFLAAAGLCAAADYRVLNTIPIGGEGGWDYLTVDGAAHRLYVSHATHVVVVDLESGKIAGDIPDTPGVHGIAIVPALNKGFISNGRGNDVTVFDLKTLKSTGKVATGQNPDAIVYDPHSNCVFTFNGRSHNSTVIEAASGAVKATIPLGGKPEFAVVDGHGKLWVNIEDTHEIAEIDTGNARVTGRYLLNGCEEPSGLALDADHNRLFSVCGNKVMAISDPAARKVIATVPIGAGVDGAAFDQERHLAFSSNGADGTMTIVETSGNGYRVAATVATARGARTITLDAATHKLYLPTAAFAAAVAGQRPSPEPNSFKVLVVGR